MDFRIPIGKWVESVVDFMLDNGQPALDVIQSIIDGFGFSVDWGLQALPTWLLIGLITGVGLWRLGWGFALFSLAAQLLIVSMTLWDPTVVTLGLVLSSTLVSLAIGVPLGIWTTRSRTIDTVSRTVLDFMQTMPAFVYLIPAVIFFGLGRVPGIIATVIFAMPPAVRLTALGIRQVPTEIVEAGRAFGCTRSQLLWRVQLPNAMPTIMAGVNQTMMLALSMIVIASMIGAGGLGNNVLQSIQRLQTGAGFESGLAVVLLAIILDRITQSFGRRDPAKATGSVFELMKRRLAPQPAA